jgi:uncharacterized membrane protein YidH (DUF202 family)
LSGVKGFDTLRKIASFLVIKFGTSFRNAKLNNANFTGAKVHNSDFSNADLSGTNWEGSKKINFITTADKFTPKKKMMEQIQTVREHPALSNTDLAFERTMLAYERTLMAWIRTGVSLISFGFTLYKFFEEWRKTEQPAQTLFTPRIVGMIMIFWFAGLLLHRSNITGR